MLTRKAFPGKGKKKFKKSKENQKLKSLTQT